MKYLVDKYMERKDWNRKQSGGSIWNSPHYVEIQSADLDPLPNFPLKHRLYLIW